MTTVPGRRHAEHPEHIVIVGGGITGLAAAHAIARANREHGYGVRCTLLESSSRLGGKVQTEQADGFLVEQGPDAMLARKADGRQFCEQLGLGGDLIGSNSAGGTYVVHRGRLQPLPESMVLVAPTRLRPWLTTPLISPLGKLRAGLDLVLPARTDGADETLEGFVRRRFGPEVADRLAVPLLAAVYGGGSGDLSLQATFPDLGALERKHRSVLLGLRAMGQRRQSPGQAPAESPGQTRGQTAARGPGAPGAGSVFVSLRGGMHAMVTSAVQAIDGVQIVRDAPVRSVEPAVHAGRSGYRVRLADGAAVDADGVILATPAYATQRLVEGLAPTAAEALAAIDYLPT